MIIDCHGHYTTAPRSLEAYRAQQAALFPDAAKLEALAPPRIGDDQLRDSIESGQLRIQQTDPETGHHFDDTRRYIDAVPWLSAEDRAKIFEANARRVYPRLNGWLELHGYHPP
jgi:hypothetical protein